MFGSLPSIVPGLHEETAADLMATASVRMKSLNEMVVQLLLDVPMMQRSKQYYLKKMEEFFQNCKQPAGMYVCIYYKYRLTHGFRRYTGNIPEVLMNTTQGHKHRGYSPYTL